MQKFYFGSTISDGEKNKAKTGIDSSRLNTAEEPTLSTGAGRNVWQMGRNPSGHIQQQAKISTETEEDKH